MMSLQKNLDNNLLPEKISLICEWFDSKKNIWNGWHIASMDTAEQFWNVISIVHGYPDEIFDSAINNDLPIMRRSQMSVKEDYEYFESIVKESKNAKSNIWDKNPQAISIKNYNNKQYIWTFGKTSHIKGDSFDSTLFIKRNIKNHAINSMTVNLTNPKNPIHLSNGICPIDNSFSKGYIPMLVLKFVTGQLNDIGVSAIIFSKTIVARKIVKVDKSLRKASDLSLGYRVRVITNKNKPIGGYRNNMHLVREYLESFSLDSDCDTRLSKCVAKISQC